MELTEEALQQSAALSGSDVEAYGANDNAAEGPSRPHPNSVGHTPHPPAHDHVEMSDRNEAMLQGSGTTVPVNAAGGSVAVEDDDEDADGEADDDYDFMNGEATLQAEYANKDDGATPAAAEGNTDDEDEGVGAVKIRPGETDDDEDHESEISVHTASEGESDGGDEWEAGEEAVEVDDDESDNVQLNTCMFCKRDEENDPGEEFATYLACSSCGDHAHQHCARKAGAMLTKTIPSKWKCPECATDDDDALHLESDDAMSRVSDTSTVVPDAQMSLPPDADAIGSLETVLEDDALNSCANQQASDGDVTEGSRRLRKRKTPSVDGDDDVISLRKRRRQTTTERPLSREGTPEDDLSQPQSSRTLRLRAPRQKTVDISRLSPTSLLVTIRTKPESMREALSQRYIPERRRTSRAAASRTPRVNGTRAREPSPEPLIAPFVSTTYSQPFYSFFDKESDDAKGKPYGGILSEAEAATTKTMPSNEDRCRFDEAKQRAEAEWKARIISMQEEIQMPAKKKKAAGPGSQIECVEFGGWEIDTWYAAPYPEEYSRNRVLYICEFCLKYMNSDYVAWRHKLKCASKHPPGDEIYRDASVSVFEVDGRKNPVYCQNLCLLAKLFLGSKTLYYDVESFLFYVLCEYDEFGYHFVGYFSKEKRASSQNNVSCILTLPIHQRKGYGNLLIDFSYLLTKAEGRTGSPEKPLSDMGLVSYRNYWRLIMCRYLLENAADEKSRSSGLSIRKISDDTGMTADDVISALEGLRCLVRDAQTGLYAFRVDLQFCREYVHKWEAKNYVKLNPAGLTWTAYVMGSSSALNLELGPAISAIAPREEDGGESQAVEVLTDAKAVVGLSNGHSKEAEAEDTKVDVGEMVNAGPSDDKENRDESVSAEGKGKGKGKRKGKGEGEGGGEGDTQGQATGSAAEVDENWAAAYRDIPPTRFAVFPPVVSGRRVERSRSRAARAPSFTATNTATPRPRASASVSSTSSRRKSSAARPRSSALRRKSGGTGRGPGRWPKGTKKSDYGNADSGPGLPPAWIERNKSLGLAPGSPATRDGGGPASGDDGMAEMKDVVRVQVDKGDGDSVVVNPSRRSEALSFASVDEAVAVVGATEAGGDGEVDAEGEEE